MTATWSSKAAAQAMYNRLWGSGFLPASTREWPCGRTAIRCSTCPTPRESTPPRGGVLDAINRLNQREYESIADPETQTRIAQYEMAFRMQTSVPELTDISNEPKHILDMYGPDVHKPGSFARCALLARRLVERDVRFVQIFHRGWDQHCNVSGDLPHQCKDVDQRPTP